jgi:hypothetical protein
MAIRAKTDDDEDEDETWGPWNSEGQVGKLVKEDKSVKDKFIQVLSDEDVPDQEDSDEDDSDEENAWAEWRRSQKEDEWRRSQKAWRARQKADEEAEEDEPRGAQQSHRKQRGKRGGVGRRGAARAAARAASWQREPPTTWTWPSWRQEQQGPPPKAIPAAAPAAWPARPPPKAMPVVPKQPLASSSSRSRSPPRLRSPPAPPLRSPPAHRSPAVIKYRKTFLPERPISVPAHPPPISVIRQLLNFALEREQRHRQQD